jgi:Tol biopolymer transport system component
MRVVACSVVALCVVLSAAGSYSAPPQGRIAYMSGGRICCPSIHTAQLDGSDKRVVIRPRHGAARHPDWSPDGHALAFAWNGELFVLPAEGSRARRVPGRFRAAVYGPSWSPDGRRIAFSGTLPGIAEMGGDGATIEVVPSRGGRVRRLSFGSFYDWSPDWSPDGKSIVFVRNPPYDFVLNPHESRLMLVDPDGPNVRPFPRRRYGQSPAWAPDGRRLAFISVRDHNGQSCTEDHCYWSGELYTMAGDGTDLRRLTFTRHDELGPTWSPDGLWIAYARQGQLYKIPAWGGPPYPIGRRGTEPAWSPR